MPPKKKSYTKKADQKHVKQELEKTSPIIVRFYRETCPACQMSRPAWEQFCGEMEPSQYRLVEVEEEAIPLEILQGISAFPTYAKHDQNGSGHTVGAVLTPADLHKKLKV